MTTELSCGDLRFVIRIVANFYMVQYEHIKRDAVGCVYICLYQISWGRLRFLPKMACD